MKRYDLYVLDSSKDVVAAMPDSVWEISETLNIDDTLRAVLYERDKFSLVTAENTFLRLVNPDDSTDKRTYRVTSVEQGRVDGRYTLQCEGSRIWTDMGREIYEGWHPFRNIQVKTIVAELLGSSAFQIKSGGNAESDTTIIESLDFAYTSVLEAMQRVAELADLEIEIDESTSPESIDLKTRGSDNNVRFEYGINTSGLARRFRRADVVNKVYPVGGGAPPATCKGALFEVYSIATDTVTVAGNKCIPSDDTYNTYKIEFVTGSEAGTDYTISDTTRGSSGDDDTIVLSSTPSSVSAGDLFKFTDSSGNELDFVPDAASQSTYGTFDGVVRDLQFEAIRTLIVPGFMDGTYASGLHDGWTKTGTPTVAENTDIAYIQHGQSSQHVDAASDTHGIYYDVSLDSSEYYSCAVNLYVVSGSVEVKITTTGATGGVTYNNQGGTSGTGWLTVELEGLPIEGNSARLTIAATGGAAEFYVDAVSFTGTQQTRQFVRENGARELYRMAFDYLDEHDAPMVEYDLPNALDLYQIDPARYPFADVDIGDTVTVVDVGMGLSASVRVLTLGRDSQGSKLRLKLSSHVSTMAAFSQVAPGAGRVVSTKRRLSTDENNQRRNNETGASIATKINKIASNAARASRFTGDMTATGQGSFDVGSGTLYVGDNLSYSIASQSISGLSGNTVYYLYFDPASASSGLQTTTSAATAYGRDNIQVGVLKTGASSDDNVQIYDTTGAQVSGEILTRGMEAYDTSGNKRIDIGVLQDPSASIGNPGSWGVQITDGVSQNTSLLAEYTGSIPGAVRYQYVTFGDENEDLTYDTTTQVLYGDYGSYFAKSSANFFMHKIGGELVSGSSGHLYGYAAGSSLLNSGSGNTYGFYSGVVQTAGGGHAYGLYVGDSLGVRSTSTGNAYGIYINAVTSTSGTAYSIYDNTTNRAYFGGSISVRGVDYVWPSSDGTNTYVLQTDGSGNLSWVANAGGLSGSGTTNYIPKWSSSSNLTDSVIYDDGTNVGIGISSLSAKLHVNGKLRSVGTTTYEGYYDSVTPALFINAGSDGAFYLYDGVGGGTLGIVQKGGNVGIGTTTIPAPLTVQSQASNAYGIVIAGRSSDSIGEIVFKNYAQSSDYCTIQANSSDFRINALATLSLNDAVSGNVLLVEGGGNVGIGTSSPSSQLDVRSSGVNVSWGSSGAIFGNLAYTTGVAQIYANTSTALGLGANNSASHLYIDTSGNVGIGTSSPSAKLDLIGTLAVSSTSTFGGAMTINAGLDVKSTIADISVISTSSGTNSSSISFYENTSSLRAQLIFSNGGNALSLGTLGADALNFATNNTSALYIDTSQEVGINTTSPSSTLHIYDGSSGTTAGIRLENNSGSDWGIGELVFNDTFSIYDFGASDGRLNIQSDGDVGIGTLTPNWRLHVAKNDPASSIYIGQFESSKTTTTNASSILGLNWSAVSPNDANHAFLWMQDSTTARAYILSNGAFYGNGTYGTVSDQRLKTDIQVARSYWNDFKSLEYKTYKMISDGEMAKNMLGLIAQDVEQVFPRMVEYNNEGYKTVKSSVIGEIGNSVLIEAQQRIEELEAEVAALKAAAA